MFKGYFLISLFIISIIYSGCKKDLQKGPFRKIITEVAINGDSTSYEYNSEGNLSRKIEYFINSEVNTHTFTYTQNTITVVMVNSGNLIHNRAGYTTTLVHKLNTQGYISNTIYSLNGQLQFTTDYEYNNDGNCVKEIQNIGQKPLTYSYEYSGGNKIKTTKALDGPLSYSFYTYSNKENSLSQNHYGFDFYGKESINLIETEEIDNSDYTQTKFKYEYEFDRHNYATKRTKTSISSMCWDKYIYQ